MDLSPDFSQCAMGCYVLSTGETLRAQPTMPGRVDVMPKGLERRLQREAARKGLTGRRERAYVYGTLRKTGWRPNPRGRAPHARWKRHKR